MEVELPYNFNFRDYQIPLQDAFIDMLDGEPEALKRFYYIWHRRCGKDLAALNLTAMATQARIGTYWHMLPQKEQVRKAIWEGMTKDGRRFIDVFPGALNPKMKGSIVQSINNSEMKIKFKNGSVWYALGSDGYENLLGTNPVGVVFSEYAYSNPNAWGAVEPILMDNGGWAIKETTPEGENHACTEWDIAKKSPRWWTQMLTIDDTNLISKEQIEQIREDGTDEETIEKFYYCSFQASVRGAYFAEDVRKAINEGRITKVPHNTSVEVHTWWDLGVSDYTSIVFVQQVGRELHIIDFFQDCGEEPAYYVKELKRLEDERGYNYGQHHLPHDGNHRQFTAGLKTPEEELLAAGLKRTIVHKRVTEKQLGINAIRSLFSRMVFDEERTEYLLNAIKSYTKKWDDNKNMYLDKPLHNWASHPVDALMGLAQGYFEQQNVDLPDDPLGLGSFSNMLKQHQQSKGGLNAKRI